MDGGSPMGLFLHLDVLVTSVCGRSSREDCERGRPKPWRGCRLKLANHSVRPIRTGSSGPWIASTRIRSPCTSGSRGATIRRRASLCRSMCCRILVIFDGWAPTLAPPPLVNGMTDDLIPVALHVMRVGPWCSSWLASFRFQPGRSTAAWGTRNMYIG